jgi:hypothetical protein
MGKMISPAGDMEITMIDIDRDGDELVITGQMGIWDAKIYLGSNEIISLIKLMLKRTVVGYILSLPYLSRKRERKS